MGCRNLLLSAMILATCSAAQAQSPAYGLGTTASPAQIKAWDITISDEGKGLPAGSGTAVEGAKIYAQKCAACHGQNATGGQAPALWDNKNSTAASGHPHHYFPTEVPFAPVLWDYIHRAMPMLTGPGTLKPDEVYSLTAFLLYKNDVIKETEVLDAQTLPKVKMPDRAAFVPPVLTGR